MPFACIFVPDFPVEAILRVEPELRSQAVAVLEGKPPLQKIFATNEKARQLGIESGMTKIQVEPWTDLVLRPRSPLPETSAHAALLDCAQSFSPRIEDTAPDTVLLDLSGLESLFGSLPKIASDIARRTSDLGLEANVATASNPDTARFAARGFAGVTVVPEGKESEQLGNLPLDVLFPELTAPNPPEETARLLETFDLWGVRNLRALCALPEVALSERLGQQGIQLQKLARGAISRTIVPVDPPLVFEEAIELEHPIVLLEPLAFLLAHMLDQLCARLAARALAAQELRLRLELDSGFQSIDDFDCHPEQSESSDERSGGPMYFADSNRAKALQTTMDHVGTDALVRPSRASARQSVDSIASQLATRDSQGFDCHPERGAFERSENRAKDVSERPRRDPAPSGIAISATRASSFTRTLQLPVPMLDAKVFLKLLQLDLKAHPPGAPILKIHLAAEPVQPRNVQGGLFLPPTPEPEKLELTLARIAGMVGEDKVGSLQLLDSHRPEAFRMQRFAPADPKGEKVKNDGASSAAPITALRIFRPPPRAKVTLHDGKPKHVVCLKRKEISGDILWMAGPWRSSGDWWERDGWAREEWDIAVQLSAKTSSQLPVLSSQFAVKQSQSNRLSAISHELSAQKRSPTQDRSFGELHLALFRLVHDLLSGHWFVEGMYD
jgi:nucleotidyltransferase/DNA polymerase involved in DNA repair